MGTMLQASGLKLGAKPEELNITNPELIESIHAKYAAAGSRIVNANTFGASAHKLAGSAYSLEEIIAAGIANCKRACAPYGALTALDVGPLGELLEPSGTLAFEDAVSEYARIVRAGAAAGADLIFFETFTDLYELKAALLAAKENSGLPILASMSFEAGGRTFTGCTVESFGVTARGLGANAVGINCSLGPKEIFPMAKRLAEAVPGDFPVFVKPNAGLPRADGSGYDITPQLFAMEMKPYRDLHLFAAGGCCGTTPEFIKLLNSCLLYTSVRREVGQCGSQAAYMILMRVGAEHIFQLFHPLTLQVRDDETAVVHIAAVVEHELSVAFHQHTQRLTHIDKMHLQGCVHRIHSRRSRSGRVRHYIGASARDGRQPAAARKAQHQCGGSGQRSKALPQAFLRDVYKRQLPVLYRSPLVLPAPAAAVHRSSAAPPCFFEIKWS